LALEQSLRNGTRRRLQCGPFFIGQISDIHNMKTEQLATLLQPVIEDLGFQLWGIEYQPRKGDALLRIYIDHDNGISVDDCATVSHEVSGVLDVEDPIKSAYTLEVSSPGMDRTLFNPEQFAQFAGENARVTVAQAIDGQRKFRGRILGVEGDNITLDSDNNPVTIEFGNILKAKLDPKF